MNEFVPSNAYGALFLLAFVIAATFWLNISRAVARLNNDSGKQKAIRPGLALVLAAWFALAYAIADSGTLSPQTGGAERNLPLAVFVPVAIGLLLLIFSKTMREIADAMLLHELIGAQTLRFVGFIFLILADMRLLPERFANPAGYGDALVGALALPVAYLVYRRAPYARGLAVAWNVLGLLDFVIAFYSGISTDPDLFPSLVVMNRVLLIPAYLVPLFFMWHVYALRGLLLRWRSAPQSVRMREALSTSSHSVGVIIGGGIG